MVLKSYIKNLNAYLISGLLLGELKSLEGDIENWKDLGGGLKGEG